LIRLAGIAHYSFFFALNKYKQWFENAISAAAETIIQLISYISDHAFIRIIVMEKLHGTKLSMEDEAARIAVLNRYKILNTPAEPAFDNLAHLISNIFNLPICIISFIGLDEVYYKANVGLEGRSSEPRKNSIIGQVMMDGDLIVLENIKEHLDFFYNLHNIKFYVGVPLVADSGHTIGALAIMGDKPIVFGLEQEKVMFSFAKTIMGLVESRLTGFDREFLKQENQALVSDNNKLTIQNSLLTEYQLKIAQANSDLESVLDSYEMLFKYAPTAIGIYSSEEKRIWLANNALTCILGDEQMLIGEKLESIITEINGSSTCTVLDMVYQNNTPYQAKDAKLRIKLADGYKHIYVDLAMQPVGRMGDEPQNMMFILADVTEQVILNQIAQEANIVLINAIEDTGMGYTIVEFETGKMTANDQLKANYGYRGDEPFSYPDIFNAMLPKYRPIIKEAVHQAIITKGLYQEEYEVKWRDGSIHRIRAYGKPMYDVDGNATHIIGLNKVISTSG
jgi:GAF domain-containing protein/PAS domain-containing protein